MPRHVILGPGSPLLLGGGLGELVGRLTVGPCPLSDKERDGLALLLSHRSASEDGSERSLLENVTSEKRGLRYGSSR